MELFKEEYIQNILPHDGVASYYGKIMDEILAASYYQHLLNTIEWRNDEAVMFGKHLITKRKVAWYADKNFPYTYSRTTKQALPWTSELIQLKELSEMLTGSSYNSCLLNLYHNGDEGMAWHSDDEKALSPGGAIASLSFGATRKFAFKHKLSGEVIPIILQPGSLLVMKGDTQKNWLHRLPKTTKMQTPRINLTFRSMVDLQSPAR